MAMTTPTSDGARPLRTLLIANRGEIAVRIARACADLGVRTVAVYSDADRDALFVRAADTAVPLGGRTAAESYLDGVRIVAAAERAGADAIHPGYGFLSENPDFAQAVIDAGLIWVGPSPASMRAMALKVEARRIAEAAGVPVVPGAELSADVSDDDLIEAASRVGFPLLVKASAGGGGRGMRIVTAADELVSAVESARREAQSAFGDSTVFLELYLQQARHVEVQVFGDHHGNVVHLGERECSVQRRHQKVIEESPVFGLTDHTRDTMRTAAVALARAIDYVGAGTVEFVVSGDGATQTVHFLEMNTRLQVEHPVTELAYGVSLIEWQLRIAEGRSLPVTQDELQVRACAIEVRLYAEDPAHGFSPSSGEMHVFEFHDGVRVDSGVESGSVIGTYYDPMLAKVIAVAPRRDQAALRLAAHLRSAVLHGPVTNRDSLVAVLESDDFLSGRVTTGFLDEHPDLLAPQVPDERRRLHLAAAALAEAAREREQIRSEPAAATAFAPSGWRNVAAVPEARSFATDAGEVTVAYERLRDGRWRVGLCAESIDQVGVASIDWYAVPLTVAAEVDGEHVVLDIESDERLFVRVIGDSSGLVTVHDGLWNSRFHAIPRFAGDTESEQGGGSTAPVPGTVTVVSVAVGDAVEAGQTLVVLEAMKMEHRIVADAAGVVTAVHVAVGDAVDAHAVVVTVESESEESS